MSEADQVQKCADCGTSFPTFGVYTDHLPCTGRADPQFAAFITLLDRFVVAAEKRNELEERKVALEEKNALNIRWIADRVQDFVDKSFHTVR